MLVPFDIQSFNDSLFASIDFLHTLQRITDVQNLQCDIDLKMPGSLMAAGAATALNTAIVYLCYSCTMCH